MQDLTGAFRLDGKVAVVTGAASGIGRCAAETFAAAGAAVVLGDLNGEELGRVAAELSEDGASVFEHELDVSDKSSVEELVGIASERAGRLDVMANVAGIAHEDWIANWDEEVVDRLLAVNFKSALWGCQAAVAAMADTGGSIINVASSVIDITAPRFGLYAITKQAVTQLTRTLAMEAGRHGIRVNAIAPGATVTNFTKRHLYDEHGNLDQQKYESFIERQRKMSPLGLSGEPQDQAWLMLYLASDASRYCTGQTWRANGGTVIPS